MGMSLSEITGQRIDDLIQEDGKTVSEIASKSRVSASLLSEMRNIDERRPQESGVENKKARNIGSINLIKLCKYFGVSADYLLGLTDQKSPDPDTKNICAATGLSATAASYLKSLKYEPYIPELLSSIFESEYFPLILESLKKSAECKNSSLVRFRNKHADDMKQLIDKMGGTIKEYSPEKSLTVDDAVFDRSMMMLSQISPNMTALSRADAIKFHLQEAERAFRLAAEDAINK